MQLVVLKPYHAPSVGALFLQVCFVTAHAEAGVGDCPCPPSQKHCVPGAALPEETIANGFVVKITSKLMPDMECFERAEAISESMLSECKDTTKIMRTALYCSQLPQCVQVRFIT